MVGTIEGISGEMARWLRTRPGVADVREVKPQPKRSRLPLPVPIPPALRPPQATFELHFSYKGRPRVFRYFIEQQDAPATIVNTLKVHTNGELMVSVPNDFGQAQPNDIYYSNRSIVGAGLGDPAPNTRTKG